MIIRDCLLILHKNIPCDPSSGPSRQDGSGEGSQHMVWMRNKKNCHQKLPLILSSAPNMCLCVVESVAYT